MLMERKGVYFQVLATWKMGTHVSKSFTHKLCTRVRTCRNEAKRMAGRVLFPTATALVNLYIFRWVCWLFLLPTLEADLRPALRTTAGRLNASPVALGGEETCLEDTRWRAAVAVPADVSAGSHGTLSRVPYAGQQHLLPPPVALGAL